MKERPLPLMSSQNYWCRGRRRRLSEKPKTRKRRGKSPLECGRSLKMSSESITISKITEESETIDVKEKFFVVIKRTSGKSL